MALMHWYCFRNNKTRNYGIGISAYQTSQFTSASKQGKVTTHSVSSGGLALTANAAKETFNNQAMTIAFWIKPLNTSSGQIFGNGDMTAPNNRKFALFQYPTGNDIHWSWQNDDSNSTFIGGALEGVLPTNTWTHVCFTYNNPTMTLYINGVKRATGTGVSNSTFENQTTLLHSSSNRQIDDLRVYNHCLSETAVKHLAHGLVMHMDFDYAPMDYIEATGTQYIRTGIIGPAIWEYDIQYTNTTKRQLMGHGGNGAEYWGTTDGVYGMSAWSKGSIAVGNRDIFRVENLSSGRKIYVNGVYSHSEGYDTRCESNEAQIFTIAGIPDYCNNCRLYGCKVWQNGSLVRDFMPAKRFGDNAIGLWDRITGTFYTNSGSGTFKCPVNDTLGSDFIMNPDKINDYVDLTVPTNYYLVKDTVMGRNSLATVSGDPESYLKPSTLFNPVIITSGTISFWYRKHSSAFNYNSGHFLVLTQRNSGDYFGATQNGTPFCSSSCSYSTFYLDGVAGANSNVQDTEWHMYTFTGVNLSAWSNIALHHHGDASWLWRGQLADFRLYSTSLSAADVKEMYENKMMIDSSNHLHCNSLITSSFHNELALETTGRLNITNIGTHNREGYIPLNYIYANGTQYIDTGWKPSNINFKVECRFKIRGTADDQTIFGCHGARLTLNAMVGVHKWQMGVGAAWYNTDHSSCATSNNIMATITSSSGSQTLKINSTAMATIGTATSLSSPAYSVTLFGQNDGSVVNYKMTGMIYSFKAWENGVLVRDMIPAISTANGKIGMWDLVTKRFYGNSGTGTITIRDWVNAINIPTNSPVKFSGGYTAVEYLEFTGSQQINTGIYFNANTDWMECDYQATTTNQNGMIVANSDTTNHFWFYYYKDSGKIDIYISNETSQYGGSSIAIDTNRHKSSYKGKAFFTDSETVYANWSQTFTNDTESTLYIGSWGGAYYFKGKIYNVKLWKTGHLIRDFIPVKRNSDGVLGMLDLVEHKFYTNSGTGSFTNYGITKSPVLNIATDEIYEGNTWSSRTGNGWKTIWTGSNQTITTDLRVGINDATTNRQYKTSYGVKQSPLRVRITYNTMVDTGKVCATSLGSQIIVNTDVNYAYIYDGSTNYGYLAFHVDHYNGRLGAAYDAPGRIVVSMAINCNAGSYIQGAIYKIEVLE